MRGYGEGVHRAVIAAASSWLCSLKEINDFNDKHHIDVRFSANRLTCQSLHGDIQIGFVPQIVAG